METNEKKSKKHFKEILKVVKKMNIEGYSILDEKVRFKGYVIDLSATNPDPMSIAYTTLSQL